VYNLQDWIKNNRPDVYASTNYTCLEISSQLAAQQYESVVVKGGHGGRCGLYFKGNMFHTPPAAVPWMMSMSCGL